jgi:homoaconitate hydratase
MGSRNADTYLASPAVVAASAIAGKIYFPSSGKLTEVKGNLTSTKISSKQKSEVKILPGFPETMQGELIFCHQDNLNTDGIYPGKYTYLDDFTPQQQAQVVMENYDPEFKSLVKKGDLLAGGFNFGTGSSREQAATALKYRGLQLVIAGSFNETYKRNALNNGFLIIEAAELIRDLKIKFGDAKPTVRTGIKATVDFRLSEIHTAEKKYSIDPVGVAAQELIIKEGLEAWVKQQLLAGKS